MIRARREDNDEPESLDGSGAPSWLKTLNAAQAQSEAKGASANLSALAVALSLSLADLDELSRPPPGGTGGSGGGTAPARPGNAETVNITAAVEAVAKASRLAVDNDGDTESRHSGIEAALPSLATVSAIFDDVGEEDAAWMGGGDSDHLPAAKPADHELSAEFRQIISVLDDGVDVDQYVADANIDDRDLLRHHAPKAAEVFANPAAVTLESALDAYLNTALGDQADDETVSSINQTARHWLDASRYYPSSPTPDEAEDDVATRQRLCLESLMTLSDTGL